MRWTDDMVSSVTFLTRVPWFWLHASVSSSTQWVGGVWRHSLPLLFLSLVYIYLLVKLTWHDQYQPWWLRRNFTWRESLMLVFPQVFPQLPNSEVLSKYLAALWNNQLLLGFLKLIKHVWFTQGCIQYYYYCAFIQSFQSKNTQTKPIW